MIAELGDIQRAQNTQGHCWPGIRIGYLDAQEQRYFEPRGKVGYKYLNKLMNKAFFWLPVDIGILPKVKFWRWCGGSLGEISRKFQSSSIVLKGDPHILTLFLD